MQNVNMKKLSIIAAMLLAAGTANAAEGDLDLSSVTTMFAAALAALTAFAATTNLGKTGLAAMLWAWRKVVGIVNR